MTHIDETSVETYYSSSHLAVAIATTAAQVKLIKQGDATQQTVPRAFCDGNSDSDKQIVSLMASKI